MESNDDFSISTSSLAYDDCEETDRDEFAGSSSELKELDEEATPDAPEPIVTKEQRLVSCSRWLVFLALMAAAVVLGIFTYCYVSDEQKEAMKEEVRAKPSFLSDAFYIRFSPFLIFVLVPVL
jgi:hypothetical protein